MSRQGGKGRNVPFLPGLVMGMKSEKNASIESASKKRRSISAEKATARQQNFVRAPKIAMRRFPYANMVGSRIKKMREIDNFVQIR